MSTISPFAPDKFPDMPPIDGFEMATAESGLKYKDRPDLWVLRAAPGTEIAGIFTKNQAPGAPIDWSRRAITAKVGHDAPRLIVINSGNSNVFTGAAGMATCTQIASEAAQIFGGDPAHVLIGSTGVIGQPLDANVLTRCFPDMSTKMSPNAWPIAAQAIMTTDTYPKGSVAKTQIDGAPVKLCGFAKGSGMIAPDMATMLGFIFTDAAISRDALQALLLELGQLSFNAITVDSDTSTSDMVLLVASGRAGHKRIERETDPALGDFKEALAALMMDLALQIVKDGEGISKLIRVNVTGATSDKSARAIAMSIANSPLVKTAVAGEDANWGRIVMAVGKAGEPVDRDRLTVGLGPHILARDGKLSSAYREADGALYMKNSEIDIHVDIGLGDGKFTVWGSDLTHAYVSINADYRS